MGIYDWVSDLPPGTFVLPATSDFTEARDRTGVESEKWRTCVMFRSTFDRLSKYESTIPTAPSAGRIYRRPSRDERGPDQDYVRVVYNHPDGDQIHIPYVCHVIEGF